MPTDDFVQGSDDVVTSLTLLNRVRKKDEAAWERLVSLYSPLVTRWARRWQLQDADVADLLQDLFVAVAKNLGDFRRTAEEGSFRGWLRTIAFHQVCDRWKQQKRGGESNAYRQLIESFVEDEKHDSEVSAPDEKGILYKRAVELVLKDFEPRTGRAFWLLVVDGRAPADVAEELGISANAVYLAKARVLSRLREEFADVIR